MERAFGLLKARWISLLHELDAFIKNVSAVLITCSVSQKLMAIYILKMMMF